MPAFALCAVADDAHAGDVVATGTRLAVAFDLQPLFVHVRPAPEIDQAGLSLTTPPPALSKGFFDSIGVPAEHAQVDVADTPEHALLRDSRNRTCG
jgi:hypothetical protein